jgi:hypothetical protein
MHCIQGVRRTIFVLGMMLLCFGCLTGSIIHYRNGGSFIFVAVACAVLPAGIISGLAALLALFARYRNWFYTPSDAAIDICSVMVTLVYVGFACIVWACCCKNKQKKQVSPQQVSPQSPVATTARVEEDEARTSLLQDQPSQQQE